MAIRLTWFFTGPGSFGWTETFFDSSATQAAALTKADTNLRPSRLGVLSSTFSLRQIRASDESINRDSLIKSYTAAQGAGTATVTTPDPGDWGPGPQAFAPQTALLVRMEAGALNRRMFLLRGVPIGPFGADLIYNPSAVWLGLFNAWANAWTGATGAQLRLQGAGPASFPTNLTVIAPGFSFSFIYPGNAPAGMVAGAKIRLSRWLGAAFLNGVWTVSTVLQPGGAGTQTTVGVFPKTRQIYGTPAIVGQVNVLTPTFVNFTSAIPLRGAKKNIGRPFGLLRGRARVRKA